MRRGKINSAAILAIVILCVATARPSHARTWWDNTGRYSVEADFVKVVEGTVYLRRPDGRGVNIPLDRLSEADRAYVARLTVSTDSVGENRRSQAAPSAVVPGTGSGRKLALLIGISDYLSGDLTDLAGCVNDVHDMKDLLVGKFDFAEQDVLVLTDGQATHNGIVQAFREHLIDKATSDSIVVFHFSGHGSLMQDWNGDELDRIDETIVPYDSRTPGVFDISDDELNGLFTALSAKTSNVTFILDSCHSGSGVRSVGPGARFVKQDDRPQPESLAQSSRSARGTTNQRFENRNYTLIAGCRPDELSYEYYDGAEMRGTLTYCLTNEIRASGSSAVTYRDIMDQVKAKVNAIHRVQHPQLEGANMDHFVFGDQASLAQPYILVSPKNGGVELRAGRILGLTKGSKFDVYPPGTKRFDDPSQAIAKVELTSVNTYTSQGTIIDAGPIPLSSRAVLRIQSFEGRPFPIFFDLTGQSSSDAVANSDILRSIHERLINETRVKDHFVVVDQLGKGRFVVSERQDGHVHITGGKGAQIDSPPVPTQDPDAIQRVLSQVEHWAKWFNVLDLENVASGLDVDFGIHGPQHVVESEEYDQVFLHDDDIEFTVKNNSSKLLYFAILNLSSDGSRTVIYPPLGDAEPLAPGESWSEPTKVFVPPAQQATTDYLKLFVFDQQFDISFLRSDAAPRSVEDDRAFPQAFPLAKALFRSRGIRPIRRDSWTAKSHVLRVRAAD